MYRIPIMQLSSMTASTLMEHADRMSVFRQARAEADRLGKPLMNYGCGKIQPYISLSDINVDVVPRDAPNFVLVKHAGPQSESINLPFNDNEVITYCSHVLEHVKDPNALMDELERISEKVYIVVPRVSNISAWLHPRHKRMYAFGTVIQNPQLYGWFFSIATSSMLGAASQKDRWRGALIGATSGAISAGLTSLFLSLATTKA